MAQPMNGLVQTYWLMWWLMWETQNHIISPENKKMSFTIGITTLMEFSDSKSLTYFAPFISHLYPMKSPPHLLQP